MKTFILKIVSASLAVIFLASMPVVVLAQNKPVSGASNKPAANKPAANAPAANGGAGSGAGSSSGSGNTLFNPIKYTNLGDLVVSMTKNFIGLIAVLSVAFIVVGGGQLVISAGNQEAVEKGKKTITWAILGLIIALLSFSIVAIVQNLIGVK